jgi:hypothetical protein
VCRVEANQEVPGAPELGVVNDDVRRWFPGAKQRAMLLENPETDARAR